MANFVFKKERDETNKYDNTVVTIEVKDTVHIADLAVAFKEFLLACGYAESTVKDYINLGDEE